MVALPNKSVILNFYRSVNNVDFTNLDSDKMIELDEAVEKWRYYFTNNSAGLISFMTFTAERLFTSNGRYTAVTPTEKIYFYIKMVDPNFYFLEAYEAGNTKDEIKNLCLSNFRIYDHFLIHYEKELYSTLLDVPDDLWALNRIKR
ncbi:MAG: hypothetical protein E7164_00365 [Firmicutes bacterium]|nr:hypothetical protein [Bacillota bacterium]